MIDVLEMPTASIIRAVSTSEVSGNFCLAAWCNFPGRQSSSRQSLLVL